jgi:hypothetical protein
MIILQKGIAPKQVWGYTENMNMDIFWLLISNLAILGFFLLSCYGMSKYTLAWFLRVQRTKYVVQSFYEKFILLEIKMPREITRSPQAMEFIIDAIYQVAGNNDKPKPDREKGETYFSFREKFRNYWSDRYLKGEQKLWMSLEIESRGGEIHFYIGTLKKYKEILSSYIYSQYPGIEVTEADDYTNKIRPVLHGGGHEPWTSYGILVGENKSYLPIKTYIDFGLDKDPKDEHKVDPLIPLLESMANIKPDESVWYQIIVRAVHDGKKWKKDGQDRIDKIMGIKRAEKDEPEKHHKKGDIIEQNKELTKLSPKDKNEIDLIQRNIDKLGFDTRLHIVYIAPKGKLRPEGDQIVRNAMKSFNNPSFNSFKMENQNSTQPWHDYQDRRRETRKRASWFYLYVTRNPLIGATSLDGAPFKGIIDRYKGYGFRSAKEFFYDDLLPYFKTINDDELEMGLSFVLNAEELATIYHFPSRAFAAPKFGRVESVKSEPPTNLPF